MISTPSMGAGAWGWGMAVERAVVTGGAGFVGSSVVEALAGRGTSVLVVDDLSTGSAANLDRIAGDVELFKHDIRDGAPLRDAVAAFPPDLVFHLAARTDVRASMSDPQDDASVNVLGSINVFSAAAAAGVRRLVNASTGGAIYSPAAPIPTPETAPVAPLSAYGLSKRVVEEYADWFRSSSGLDVVTLRYGNVYGRARTRPATPGSWPSSASGCSPVAGPSSSATAPRPATSSTSPTSPRPTSPRPRSRTRATASTTSAPGSRCRSSSWRGRRRWPRASIHKPSRRCRRRPAPARCSAAASTCAGPPRSSRSADRCRWWRACTGHSSGSLRGEPAPASPGAGTGPRPAVRPAARALARERRQAAHRAPRARGDRRLGARRGATHGAVADRRPDRGGRSPGAGTAPDRRHAARP